jgi:hypothetical protein
MTISVIDPIPRALAYTKRVLFQPFDLGKWFVIGFTAFLAMLSDGGGGGGSFNMPTGHGGGGGGGDQIMAFIADHIVLIGGIVAVAIVVLLAVTALLLWIGCRGRFMFLDNVARNRAEVVEPWKRFRELGNNLFVFEFIVTVLVFLLVLLILGSTVAIAWPDITDRVFREAALTALIVMLVGLVLVAIGIGLFNSMIRWFVVPVMYLRNVGALPALRIFGRELLAGHVGHFILFVLMSMVLGVAIGILVVVAIVCTCCIACCVLCIPYINTVALLPVLVFTRSYSLYFLEQFGPQWRVIQPASAAPVA